MAMGIRLMRFLQSGIAFLKGFLITIHYFRRLFQMKLKRISLILAPLCLLILCGSIFAQEGITPDVKSGMEGLVMETVSPTGAGTPIAGALLQIFANTASGDVSTTPVAERKTNMYGYYRFYGLESGNYFVRVSKEGYREAKEQIMIPENEILKKNFYLMSNQEPTPTPTTTPPPEKATLFGNVSELSYDSTTPPAPIEGAVIQVYGTWYNKDGSIQPFREAKTDEKGNYEIPDMPYARYSVIAKADGYRGDHASIEINKPEAVLDFLLLKIEDPTPTPTGTPQEIGILRGTVMEEIDGAGTIIKPIEGALVRVYGIWTDGTTGTFGPVKETKTDENGEYNIPDMPYGNFSVSVKAESFFPGHSQVEINKPETVLDFYLRKIEEPTPTPTGTPQEFSLLYGKVVEDVGMLTIVPSPIANAHILVYIICDASNPGIPYYPIREAKTDENGDYEIKDMPRGKFNVVAKAPNFHPAEAIVEINMAEVMQNFKLKKAEEPTPTPTVTPTATPPQGHVLYGRVVEDVGMLEIVPPPIAKAHVIVFYTWGSLEEDTKKPVADAWTDENGKYKISGLDKGKYYVVVHAEKYLPGEAFVEINAPEVMQNFKLTKIGEPTPTPTATPVEKAVLFGVVVEDTGELDIIPPPIAGAVIKVFRTWNSSDEEKYPESDPVYEAMTNNLGEYKIPGIIYGHYIVTAEARGFRSEKTMIKIDKPELNQNFMLEKISGPTPTPTETPGDPGKLFGIVTGIKDNSTSEPVLLEGAIVEIFPPVDCDDNNKIDCIVPPVARAITNENGFYVIPEVHPGYWEVKVRAKGYFPGFDVFEMKPNGEVQLDFTLKAGISPKPGVIEGVVLEYTTYQTFAPTWIPGAKIEVYPSPVYDSAGDIIPGTEPVAITHTNHIGQYRVEGLEEGVYIVRASAEDFFPEHKRAKVSETPARVNFTLKRIPEPTPTPVGCGILGRVFEKKSWHDEGGAKPISGATVIIQKKHWNWDDKTNEDEPGTERKPIIVYTGDDGYYKALNLEPGHYSIEVRARGYHSRFRHTYLRQDKIKTIHFALRPKNPNPTPTPSPEFSMLFGKVFELSPRSSDRFTTPVTGAVISLYSLRNDTGLWPERDPVAQVETDEKGNYIIERIKSGPYMVVAESAGYRRSMKEAILPPGERVKLNFGLIPDIEPTPTPVPEDGAITGEVLGITPNGAVLPIEGAEVLLFDTNRISDENLPAPILSVITDENGLFKMNEIAAGYYILMANAPGFETAARKTYVKSGQLSEVKFRLRPIVDPTPTPVPSKGSIEGHVTTEKDGSLIPVPSARLTAIRLNNEMKDMMGDRPVHNTASDEFGFYKFEDLLPGRYLLIASARGFKPAKEEAGVLQDETTIMDFVLEQKDEATTDTGTIYGTVMTIDKSTTGECNLKPLPETSIVILKIQYSLEMDETLIPAGRAETDDMGTFVVDNLPKGLYVVLAQKEGYSWGIRKARVKPLDETKVKFLLIALGDTEPDPEGEDVYDNDFDSNDEEWNPVTIPDFFTAPETERENGRIKIRCHNNTNTFGYWHSPLDAVPVSKGNIYKARFSITSDVTDLEKVPGIRIRINSQNEQFSDSLTIISLGNGAVSPGPDGRVYSLYFTLPSQEILLPEREDDLYISFDLINMDSGDEANATVSLDWIKITSVPKSTLPAGTEVASFDFSKGKHGWENQLPDVFTSPETKSAPDVDALELKAKNNTDTYGSWVSPQGVIPMEANTLYDITWKIYSDQADTSSVPGIRLRAADASSRLITQKCIFSNTEGDNSPNVIGRVYKLYYITPEELAGSGLNLSFDITNFDRNDAVTGTVGLNSVSVRAIPLNEMP
jgi:carboxypeptidase family protein/PEGA domain-containing protein